ncbi:MAG: tRNA (adenosine(37)-N6)-threonylcarbamoyltransferase complex ATPase subunit type 1 TsaE [Salinivirgaceae bacterium]|nr:tRNA (adenosine(37)-N6)-threonylcarbamoyltransferase complex ATPase subunit type 1 TsaE [Salinivirgaceae bacterium]
MNDIVFKDLSEIQKAAKQFVSQMNAKKHFAFYGEMGAGKTTFIKEICKQLQVLDVVTSPTFAIINEYFTENKMRIYHFDFYRINDIEEVYNLGYEDYFYSDDYCFIEWPELVEDLLPEHMVKVSIKVNADESRTISFG